MALVKCDCDPIETNIEAALGEAEEKLRVVRQMAEEWAKLCPEDDWGSGSVSDAVIADAGRLLLRRIGEATS